MSSTEATSAPPADHPFSSWVGHRAAIRVPDDVVSTPSFRDQLGRRVVQAWTYGDPFGTPFELEQPLGRAAS